MVEFVWIDTALSCVWINQLCPRISLDIANKVDEVNAASFLNHKYFFWILIGSIIALIRWVI